MNFRKLLIGVAASLLALPSHTFALHAGRNYVGGGSVSNHSPQQSGVLAVVNNQPITLADLDPQVQQLVANLENEIAEARRRVLQEQIDELLWDAEAKRRRISVDRLLDLEVGSRLADPTAAQIEALYQANRAQFGAMDLNTARPQIVAFVRLDQEKKLLADLAARLRKRLTVVMGVDVNSPTLSPNATLATVAGRVLSAGPVIERLKQIVFELRMHAYEDTKRAIDQTIYNLLVVEEARRKNIGPEVIIRTEITDKLRSPTEDQVAKFYAENKDRIAGDLASTRTMIVNYMEQEQQKSLELALSERLRSRSTISFMLKEPEAPVVAVSADDDPSRGDPNAPVSLVVFTDFQCPSCAFNHPIIDEVTGTYGNNVRLVVRDFPLTMHENARMAAEAANAAFAQGKFFEYIQVLFKNQKALDVASLKKYAGEVGLNRVKFDAALDRRTYAAEVDKDIDDGRLYGVLGTPTVFVNGVKVRNLSAETLREAIDRALAQKKQSASSVAPPK